MRERCADKPFDVMHRTVRVNAAVRPPRGGGRTVTTVLLTLPAHGAGHTGDGGDQSTLEGADRTLLDGLLAREVEVLLPAGRRRLDDRLTGRGEGATSPTARRPSP